MEVQARVQSGFHTLPFSGRLVDTHALEVNHGLYAYYQDYVQTYLRGWGWHWLAVVAVLALGNLAFALMSWATLGDLSVFGLFVAFPFYATYAFLKARPIQERSITLVQGHLMPLDPVHEPFVYRVRALLEGRDPNQDPDYMFAWSRMVDRAYRVALLLYQRNKVGSLLPPDRGRLLPATGEAVLKAALWLVPVLAISLGITVVVILIRSAGGAP